MGPVADHDIQQDDTDALLPQRALEVAVAQFRLDHRMRVAARVLVGAKVEQAMRCAGRFRAGNWNVRRQLQAVVHEHDLRFGAQRAAAEQAADAAFRF